MIRNHSLAAVLFLGAIACASAQSEQSTDGGSGSNSSQRTFRYYSFDAVNADYSRAGNASVNLKTVVDVGPFLYVTGTLSANWRVTGWGTGVTTETNTILLYHNGTLTLELAQFGDPAKTSGTPTGKQSIDLQGRVQCFNNKTSAVLFDSGQVPSINLNSVFTASGPQFNVYATGGVLRLNLSRTISVGADNGPGDYQNNGIIEVQSN
ncbi:MAG: hypothetical protein P4L46_17885 [Fimbriimonas sp.]|nr:hypothetical protein [Fimbriimonas sp.]